MKGMDGDLLRLHSLADMRQSIVVVMVLVLVGCAQFEYSQWRSDEENTIRIKRMYLTAIKSCDGRSPERHKACTRRVETELHSRFEDRNEAFMNEVDVAAIIATGVIIQYQMDKATSKQQTRAPGGRTKANIPVGDARSIGFGISTMTTSGLSCFVPDFAPSVSVSAFTVVSAVCR